MATEINLFEQIVKFNGQVNPSKQYWFVRSNSGNYYDSFLKHGYVAVDFDQIPMEVLVNFRYLYGHDPNRLVAEVKKYLTDAKSEETNREISVRANQTARFHCLMRVGDIVICPSSLSYSLAIGVVISDVYDAIQKDLYECEYKRRRAVKWVKEVLRNNMDPYLLRSLSQQRAVSDITVHSALIERTLNNFFVQNDEANIVLNIEQPHDIDLVHYVNLFKVVDLANNFISNKGYGNNSELLYVKTALNSKGRVQIISKSIKNIGIIALLLVSIAGGGLKIDSDYINLDLSTKGLIKAVEEYQNAEENRVVVEQIRQSMDSLQVKSPDDIVKILKELPTQQK